MASEADRTAPSSEADRTASEGDADRTAAAVQDLAALPLAVDLDDTLVSTDTLWESFVAGARAHPLRILATPFWLTGGRPALKARLAELGRIEPSTLPYRNEVVAYVRQARESGRRTILATASDARVADGVAAHLGLFDEVLASDGSHNLKGAHKREALEARFGAGGFEYVGDSLADRKVWSGAGAASCVGLSDADVARVAETTPVVRRFAVARPGMRTWLRALRVYQWPKNLLVFLHVIMAHRLTEPALWLSGGLSFLSLSLCASGIYLANDLIDLPDDRAHPTKSKRPFAAGRLPLWSGVVLSPLLLALGFGLAWATLPPDFLAALAAYVVLATLYVTRLKQVAMADVVVLGCLYTLRILAGGFGTQVPGSAWILGFSLFFFLSLALLKRYADLRLLEESGATSSPGRDYHLEDAPLLLSLGPATGVMATMVLALYIQSDKVVELYGAPVVLWLLVPLLVFWISRAWRIAHRGEMDEDPVLWTARDATSWGVGLAAAGVLTLATLA